MKFCSIASGSSGNCIFVGSDKTGLLVDAGISGKRVAAGLDHIGFDPRELEGILITHEHSDHICGLGVLSRKYGIPIYATAGTWRSISTCSSLGKLPEGLYREIRADEEFSVGDFQVKPFTISHDAAEPVGYRMECGKKSAAVATDMGAYNPYIVNQLRNLDVLLLESNHDVHMLEVGIYPYYLKQRILGEKGHLSNEAAGQLLGAVLHDNLKQIFLGHLSKDNNYPALAYESVCAEITMGPNPYKAKDFRISVAKRDEISDIVEF